MVNMTGASAEEIYANPIKVRARERFRRDHVFRHLAKDKTGYVERGPDSREKRPLPYVNDGQFTASERREYGTNVLLNGEGIDGAGATRIVLMYGRVLGKEDKVRHVIRKFEGRSAGELVARLEETSPLESFVPFTRQSAEFVREYCSDLELRARKEVRPLMVDVLNSRAYLIRKYVLGQDVEPNRLHLSYLAGTGKMH